ncbi:MAG: hypothetical protein CL389_07450 [Acidiferrobacteraceae bacterium]|nr:hypothetical protein [Acidiferrobacteraceae bacterium]MDP6531778.1 hypothetical protein [Arenicellales bacterium]MDP6854748.1 hypothetical protein [Arenicellales bacterium]MDP6949052.1 hypothetical protein [Arenicellales bacterium]HCY14323.1 hypothetical protein [Gammaproteobacteria bacterium]
MKAFADGRLKAGARRSGAGAALALLLLPMLLGVMACLPFPVGDPELSEIDPKLSGIWIGGPGEAENSEEAGFLILDPYDKRTWLASLFSTKCVDEPAVEKKSGSASTAMSGSTLTADSGVDGAQGVTAETPQETDGRILHCRRMTPVEALAAGRLQVDGKLQTYKAWLTDIDGVRLMTWEPKFQAQSIIKKRASSDKAGHSLPGSDGFWFVLRVRSHAPNEVSLDIINPGVLEDLDLPSAKDGSPEFDDALKAAAGQLERMIRQNPDNPELYAGERMQFQRLPQENYNDVGDLLEAFGIEQIF